MRNISCIFLNIAIFFLFLSSHFTASRFQSVYQSHQTYLHFEQRNCSKNGTKEYIASENICVCKSGWETGIDQNPSTRVYCNIYVGSSTNNSTGTSTSTSTTEYSVIIIIVVVIIIGVCVCCCCRRPLMQCLQDCCCGCTESVSRLDFGSQGGSCKNCTSCHHPSGISYSSHYKNQQIAAQGCMHCQPSVQPIYIQQPPSIWMPSSPGVAALQHPNDIVLSNDYRGVFQDGIEIPKYGACHVTKGKWAHPKKKTADHFHGLPVSVFPMQQISKPKVMPSYSEVTSVESETQESNSNQVLACYNTNFRQASKKKHEKKGRQSHKPRQQDRKT